MGIRGNETMYRLTITLKSTPLSPMGKIKRNFTKETTNDKLRFSLNKLNENLHF
jgi:hypothetical protein